MFEKRGTVNTTTTGNDLVGTDLRADQYVGALRNNLLARKLGVRVLSGLQGNVTIPRYTTGTTAGWVAEGTGLTGSDMTFDSITLTPKHAGGITEMSRQLIQQSSPDIEQLIRDDLSFVLAQAIDSALIKGGGAALTREKIVAAVAKTFICIADESKLVPVLGAFPLPVEVIPMARSHVARQLVKLGGDPVYREGVLTDNGNVILDVHNLSITDPVKLEADINAIVGVVTNGLFAARPADLLLLGTAEGVKTLKR